MTGFLSKKNVAVTKTFLEEKGEKILFYHRDADGVTSAALVARKYNDFECIPLQSPYIPDEIMSYIEEKKPTHILLVDLAIDQDKKNIQKITSLLPKCKILIIDHHLFDYDLNSPRVTHLNPRFFDKHIYQPASYLVYRLLENITDAKEMVWISGIGVIADYGFKECKDVLDQANKEFPGLVENDPQQSLLGKAGEIISSAIILKGSMGAQKVLNVLVKAESFEEFYRNKQLRTYKKIVQKELNRILEHFEFEAQRYPDLKTIIYEIKSPLSLSSVVSTILGEKHSDSTLIIRKKTEQGWKLSLRNQSGDLDLNAILRRCTKGIGTGGGHEKAAGALVTEWSTFKKRFLAQVRESLEKKGL